MPTLELMGQRVGYRNHGECAAFYPKLPAVYLLPYSLNGLRPAGLITVYCAEYNQFRTGSKTNELIDGETGWTK